VLVSADRWPRAVRPLPAGPFREPLASLARASLVLVTRKAVPAAVAGAVEQAIRAVHPAIGVARVQLAPDVLVHTGTGARMPLSVIAGRSVLAICGVGDPRAFEAQLAAAGAHVKLCAFPDHHAYGEADIRRLAQAAATQGPGDGAVVCTLKDAVKLAARWPEGIPALWYVSQQVIVEAGRDALDLVLDAVVRARTSPAVAAG
jgi:tetraacyldisaccharide 4'-kinase